MIARNRKQASAFLTSTIATPIFLLVFFFCDVSAQGLEEILVTAQKREQSSQDIGISMSIWDEEDVERLRLGDIDFLAAATPNLQALDDAAGLTSFRIRGIGINEFQAAFDSPVGIHLDEFFLSKPMFASMGFFDVQRVEVLKGPQGTVFGRNTTGGAVNYYSKEPTEDFAAGLRVSYGNFDRFESDAYIAGALSKSINGRIALNYSDHGEGPYFNLATQSQLGDLVQIQARAQLSWSDTSTSALLSVHQGSKQGDMTPYDNLFQSTPGGLPDVTTIIREPFGRFTVNQDYSPTTDSKASGVSLRVEHEYGANTITSLTGYKRFERDNREDSDNTPTVTTNIDWFSQVDQFTQELRLSGARGNWNYLVGAYYENDHLTTVETLSASFLFDIGATGFAQLGSDHLIDTDSFAVFTSHELPLSNQLNLILGARYTNEKNNIRGQAFLTGGTAPTIGKENRIALVNRVVLVDANTSRTDDDINYKLGLNYKITPLTMAYGSLTTGFRSGGYDLAFGSPSLESFEPEDTSALEFGVKASLLNNTLSINGAIFSTEIKSYQTNVNFANELLPRRRNIGVLETIGAELDSDWQPNENWRVRLAAGYTDAEIIEVAIDSAGMPLSVDGTPLLGNRPVNTPELSLSALLNYRRPVSSAMAVELIASYSWVDERYLEIQNGADHLVSAYNTLDISVALASLDDKWRFSIWGKNVTDEEYLRYINDIPAVGLFLTINAEPRTYGVSASYDF